MVSKAWIRHKKNERDPLDEHWIVKLPQAPGPMWMICTHKSCEGWTPIFVTNCAYDMCQISWCGVCRRGGGSFGPVGCPCNGGREFGHNTRAEQPPARGKVVVLRREAEDGFSYADFGVIPFRKRSKKRRKGW